MDSQPSSLIQENKKLSPPIGSNVPTYLEGLHARLLNEWEQLDPKGFKRDPWKYPAGGGGLTCVIDEGNIFERGCISFSHVQGSYLPAAANVSRPDIAGRRFEAIGTSCIMHPRNPYVPTVHFNLRFFVASHALEKPVWWFGGGMDLTPIYGFEDDVIHFHRVCRDALMPFGASLYPQFKTRCDDYFFNKHRQEPRGVGGIFFDDWGEPGFKACFATVKSVGDHFLEAYLPIVRRRFQTPYGAREREFQAFRRGRYIEFNLVQDRGTAFGLQLGGRVESVLASLPPNAQWKYNWLPEKGSPEARLYDDFLVRKEWISCR